MKQMLVHDQLIIIGSCKHHPRPSPLQSPHPINQQMNKATNYQRQLQVFGSCLCPYKQHSGIHSHWQVFLLKQRGGQQIRSRTHMHLQKGQGVHIFNHEPQEHTVAHSHVQVSLLQKPSTLFSGQLQQPVQGWMNSYQMAQQEGFCQLQRTTQSLLQPHLEGRRMQLQICLIQVPSAGAICTPASGSQIMKSSQAYRCIQAGFRGQSLQKVISQITIIPRLSSVWGPGVIALAEGLEGKGLVCIVFRSAEGETFALETKLFCRLLEEEDLEAGAVGILKGREDNPPRLQIGMTLADFPSPENASVLKLSGFDSLGLMGFETIGSGLGTNPVGEDAAMQEANTCDNRSRGSIGLIAIEAICGRSGRSGGRGGSGVP